MKIKATLLSFITAAISPLVRAFSISLDNMKSTFDAFEVYMRNVFDQFKEYVEIKLVELEQAIQDVIQQILTLLNKVYIGGNSGPIIQPVVKNGSIQSYILSQQQVELRVPIIESPMDACSLKVYITTSLTDSWVTLGNGLQLSLGSDGLCVLKDQTYLYCIDVKTEAGVITGVVRTNLQLYST